jgi:hypothetical protein
MLICGIWSGVSDFLHSPEGRDCRRFSIVSHRAVRLGGQSVCLCATGCLAVANCTLLSLAAGLSLLIALPVYKLTRPRVTKLVEQRAPEFEQRLLTLSERQKAGDPWTEVLAEDALRVARAHTPEEFSPRRTLFTLLGTGIAAAAVLLWLVLAGPGYWGYGADLLWTGTVNAAKRPLYDIEVKPGKQDHPAQSRPSHNGKSAGLFGSACHASRQVRQRSQMGSDAS